MKMKLEDYIQHCTKWRVSRVQTRLGQYLMNKLDGSIADSEIFYEKDPKISAEKFCERYVEKA